MEIKFKKLSPYAVIPKHAYNGDAGLDLVAVDNGVYNVTHDYVEYDTAIAVEIPPGYFGALVPRSSISNTPFMLCNSLGIVDSNFRGAIKCRFRRLNNEEFKEYKFGDCIAQLIILPYEQIICKETSELSDSERGTGGFGSTDGKKNS